MSKHTAGPWQAGRDDMRSVVDGVWSKWVYAGESYVAVASGLASEDWDVVMANARLIAAAPDMLDALEDALQTCEDELQYILDNSRLRDRMRAAIAKAKGESNG